MPRSASVHLRFLLLALLLGAGLSRALPGLAAPPAQDATPTAEESGTPTATAVPVGRATLTAVDSSRFPELSAYLMVHDVTGARIGALSPATITLAENGAPVRGLSVAERDVGVQVVFVLDANDAFSARDANGVNRLEHIKQALGEFASGTPGLKPGLDVVTILAPDGKIIERTDNPALVPTALSRYETTFGGAADPFPLLRQALGYALETTPRPGMQRYIVYFSNGWNRFDIEGGLVELASQAQGAVSVHTVFVGPTGADNTLGSQNLLRLAEAVGGQRYIFTGTDSLAPLFQMLADRGRQYELTYRSTLDTTGQHRLAAQVLLPGGAVGSNEVVFPLRVEPPRVSLPGVPPNVVRVAASHDADAATADPTVLEVPLLVDFPDGHRRDLRLVQLVVDGQAVVTYTNASVVNSLAWPLAAYTEAGDRQLQARVIDELGVAAESEPVVVNVSVQWPDAPPSPPLIEQVNANWPLAAVALGGLALAVGIGAAVWVWQARRQRLAEALAQEATLAARPVRRVTRVQKVNGANGAASAAERPAPAARPGRPHVSLPSVSLPGLRWGVRPNLSAPRGQCYFQVVEPGAGGAARPDIDLAAPQLTFGRDAAVADTVFNDRSVSRLHARVVVQAGRVTIVDQGSTSGTWVNYAPVPGEAGCELHHGDLINLGRVQLRFLRRDAPPSSGNGARIIPAAPAVVPPHSAGGAPAGPTDKAGA